MNTEDNQRIKDFKSILEQAILDSNQVFVVAHDNPDLDAIASAIGVYFIVKTKFKKDCFIVINDSLEHIEAGVKKVIDKEKCKIPFINLKKYHELKGEKDLLVTTDVNKKNRVSLTDCLNEFSNIVLIDHHSEDDYTIDSDKKFITCGVSSASEIITKLFCEFKVNIDENLATYLLAGIKLDTVNYSKNTDTDTLDMIKKLFKSGAKNEEVQDLFQENFESDVRIGDLIKKLKFNMFQYALGVALEGEVYSREEIAKAADKALKYGVDASFIIGYLDEECKTVGISARSNGKLNVGKIMEEFGGGGNPTAAATIVTDATVSDLESSLTLKLSNPYCTK